jgi:hypothetical protein
MAFISELGASVTLSRDPQTYKYIIFKTMILLGAHGGVVVKALCYKPAGRGFDSRWYHWNFSVT